MPRYPAKGSNKYEAGYLLSKILRHHIGRPGRKTTNAYIFRRNEGARVFLEDLLCQDFLWKDCYNYPRAKRTDNDFYQEINRTRTGLTVDLTVAESRKRGKSRPQILGLQAKDQRELTDIINAYKIDPPLPGVKPLEEP